MHYLLMWLALWMGQVGIPFPGPGTVHSTGPACGSTVPTLYTPPGNAFARANSPAALSQFGAASQAGDTYLVFAEAISGTTMSVSDSCAGTPNFDTPTTVINAHSDGIGGVWSLFAFYNVNLCNDATNGAIITVTSDNSGILIYGFGHEFTGIATNGFDQGPASANGLTSGNVTTSCANEMLIGVLAGGDGGTVPGMNSPWASIQGSNIGAENPGWGYQVVSSTGTYNAPFINATGTVQSSIITFVTP